MPEVYTCYCGNQEWIIYNSNIECTKCKKKFMLYVQSAHNFNHGIRKRERETTQFQKRDNAVSDNPYERRA